MTTRVLPDWKVTTGYRIMLRIGWAAISMAIYLGGAAALLDSMRVWWIVVGLALAVMLLVSVLPEPVPHDLLTGPRNRVDPLRRN